MEDIVDIIIKIVATLLALGIGWLGRYLVSWLKSNLAAQDFARLEMFVAELVAAAEQMYKQSDPDGSLRLEYVEDMLVEAGYDITEAVMAMIESKVFSINLSRKSVEVFTAEGGEDHEQ